MSFYIDIGILFGFVNFGDHLLVGNRIRKNRILN